MNERELRERLNDAATAFRFGFEGSETVVRRTRRRILRTQALAGVVAVAVVLAVFTVISSLDNGLTPRPQSPIGPGPTETVPGTPEVDYMIDLNTGETTPLPKAVIESLGRDIQVLEYVGDYAASPDGSQLAYVGTGDEETPQIFIAGIDGTGVRQMTRDPKGAVSPAWSPDGTKIAYGGSDNGRVGSIFVLEVATGKSTQIIDDPPTCPRCFRDPTFTPDGSSLIYTGGTDQNLVVRTVPVNGGKSTVLIGPNEGLADAGNASMSPDGSLVTFLGSGFPEEGRGHCGPCRFVATADGSDRRVIPGHDSNPAGTWSPDGTRIVVSGDDGVSGGGIIIVDVATGDFTRVAEGDTAIWLDGHTLLVQVCRQFCP